KALFAFPSLLDGFLALNAQRFSLLSKKVQCQAMGEIKRKTALYLLELPRLRNSVIIPMKYTELADRFAVERSSLSAVFKKLEDTGIIRRKKNREIELLNIQKLEELLY
ncbi:MAG TPA: helix-turn-helix domain-containing protein, partial [Treponemataceae bacterium]|nr:helix-turn-helix domain-containing protein [Treponemataceae bacterium]